MSKVQLQGNVSGTGIFTIASPNSNTDRTLTLPDQTGTLLSSSAQGIPKSALPTGSVLQVYSASQDTQFSTTSQMNYPATLPTISQGVQVISASFTPISATSILLFWFNTYADNSVVSNTVFALFEDSTCISAIAPRYTTTTESGWANLIMLRRAAGSTSARTYSVRVGTQNPATVRINTYPSYPGAPQTTFIIQEIAA